jgi:hypothetical protein
LIKQNLSKWLLPILILTAVVAAYSVNKRNRVENETRQTTIAVEYETVEALASAQGETVDQATNDLKAQGVSAVVLSEGYLGDLISSGKATISSVSPGPEIPLTSALKLTDARQLNRVRQGLRVRFAASAGNLDLRGEMLTLPPYSPSLLRQTSIGLDPDQVAYAKRNRLEIIGRAGNPEGVTAEIVQKTLQSLHDSGADVFLPSGDQVLGRKELLGVTVSTLDQLGMRYASPEFTKIGGDVNMLEDDPGNVIRLHTAQTAELDRLDYDGAVDRFVKAGRERNMRILLVRPYSVGGAEPLSEFAGFIKSISTGLNQKGIPLGHAKTFQDPEVPRILFPLLGLLVAVSGVYVSTELFNNRRIVLTIAVLLGLLALACWVKQGRQVMALLASGIFPVVGFLQLDRLNEQKALPKPLQPLPAFCVVSLCSILGGLCVAGMLNGLPYLVKADEFKGIKISVFLPILIVGWIFVNRLLDRQKSLASPITWGTAFLGMVIVGALGFMLARTGNDGGVGASDSELQFRGMLDTLMYVRPRTKEFMVGHPILYVGIGLLFWLRSNRIDAERWAPWVVLALMVGSIGQTSVVNTLCHLHIPVALSLARITIGLVLGCIIGIGIWLFVTTFTPRRAE